MTSETLIAQTEQLGLRRFCDENLEALFELESDSVLKQFVGGPVKASRAEWLGRAAQLPTNSQQFALVYLPAGTFAGRVTLGPYESSDVIEVQVILARQFIGKALGQAACRLSMFVRIRGLGGCKGGWRR